MANFDSIFKDCGLPGIIPYGFEMDSAGYRFLCDKLKEGITFYIIADSGTGLPYYYIDEKHIFFKIFSNLEVATAESDELSLYKRYTTPACLDTIGWAEQLWKRYRDLGATHILLNNSVWVRICDLVATVNYEGILSHNTPLRNPTLNAIMYCYRQDIVADSCTYAMASLFWETFKNSKFYAPLRPANMLPTRRVLNGNNFTNHYITLQDGRNAFLIFTDNEFKSIYAGNTNLEPDDHKVVNLFTYDDIHKLIFNGPGLCAIINAYCGGLPINQEIIEEFEAISLNHHAFQNSPNVQNEFHSMLDS